MARPKPKQPAGTPELIVTMPAIVTIDTRQINLAHVAYVDYVLENGVALKATLYMDYLIPTNEGTLMQEEIELEHSDAEAFRLITRKLGLDISNIVDPKTYEASKASHKPVLYIPR